MKALTTSVLLASLLALTACKGESTEVKTDNVSVQVDEKTNSVSVQGVGEDAKIVINDGEEVIEVEVAETDTDTAEDDHEPNDEEPNDSEQFNINIDTGDVKISNENGIQIDAGGVKIDTNSLKIDAGGTTVDLSNGIDVKTDGADVKIGADGISIKTQ